MPGGRGLPSLEVETLRKQIAGLQEELRKAKAAAALAQDQESIRAHDCLKSLGITLIPASAPDFFLV